MDDALKAMGQKIYMARKAAKMSRAELGKLVDLHETTVKRYEDGDIKSPNLTNLRAFAQALQIDYHYLVDDFLGMGEKDLQEEMMVCFSSVEFFLEFNEVMDVYSNLNETGKAKALEYLNDLSSHPQYSKKATLTSI